MNIQAQQQAETGQEQTHFDVLIVGAGISGVDAAYHLQRDMPGKSFALLEKQDSFGGTWYVHRYPGIRSDSDLYTFGYSWKPWMGTPIATADEILRYLGEAIEEQDLGRHIRYGQQVRAAAWDSDAALWTLTVEDLETGISRPMTCSFLWMCQGYYRHDEGYTPDYPGQERFGGEVIHPQTWPENLDYSDKRVVVIGSGATA
ncbi:MAG: NAD(P)/FAD-dependent oxidoreductase, partial [Pseudomonadota bacterium]